MDTNDFSKQYRKYYQSLEPILKKPKTKTYSTLIFFLLVVALFGWYAIKPTIQTILYLQREIADKTQVDKQMDDKITALIQAQAAYDAATDRLTLLDQAIPTESNSFDVLEQLKNLSTQTGASIAGIHVGSAPYSSNSLPLDVSPPAAGQIPKNNELTLTLSATGPFQSISNFVNGIIGMRRLVTIDMMQITKGDDTGTQRAISVNPDILTVSMKLRTYYAFAQPTPKETNQ